MGEFGEFLQNARAYKGVTLRDVERATRINRRYLAALEQENFDELPPLTYARGIVRTYAQYLGLDPVSVLAMFENAHGQRSGGFRVVPAVKPIQAPTHWAPNFAIIAFMVVMSAVVFAWLYSAYLAPPTMPATPTVTRVETETPSSLALESPVPTASTPTVGTQVAAAPTSTPAEALSTPVPGLTPTGAAPTSTPEPAPTATPADQEHTFEIIAMDRVWVQATVDGQVVLSQILAAGERRSFRGTQLHVVSGNAPLVRVIVDGEDQGPLGAQWDDEAIFPRETGQ